MKKLSAGLWILLLFTFTSCDLIGGIFKAGMWTGVIVVVGVIMLLVWLLARAGKGR